MSTKIDDSPIPDLAATLRRTMRGDVRDDLVSRLLYATDASIYQVEPLGVAFPQNPDDLIAAIEGCAQYEVPILARGAGSSLAGQAIGAALILDCARHLDKITAIDPDQRTATVEPGVVINTLNKALAPHGLQFGPDPASAERATIGGSLANNATGAHSILYGMAADHLLAAEVVLADGSLATFSSISLEEAHCRADLPGIEGSIYRAALRIREQDGDFIKNRWPRTWRRASGYALNYLLPWSPSAPPRWSDATGGLPYPPLIDGQINLAPLLCSSEGTLAVIRKATLNLVPRPNHTALGVLAFDSIAAACDAVPALLGYGPSAVELVPQDLIRLARSVPAYASQLGWVDSLGGDPAALLVIEFSGDDPQALQSRVRGLGGDVLLAADPHQQRQVWAVRKVGLGLLLSKAGDAKPWAFIEDLAVPVEALGKFVREMERITQAHRAHASIYAHASAGCLHIRPLLNLKTVDGLSALRAIATQAVSLALGLGGSVSGEHGDGLARSEWLPRMYGEEIMQAFRELKSAADPHWLLNPGKIVTRSPEEALPVMDASLRFGLDYHAQAWTPLMDFSDQGGLSGAIEQCNGAGVCRKSEGVMCPSFQALREEEHTTRGRANLLRMLISNRFPSQEIGEKAVYQALDLCLACKGCRAECPSAVDVARLKSEFLQHFYRSPLHGGHSRRFRDYIFAYIGSFARAGSLLAPIVNPLLALPRVKSVNKRLLGISDQRKLPAFAKQSLHQMLPQEQDGVVRPLDQERRARKGPLPANPVQTLEDVIFLSDAFTEYMLPENGVAAIRVLQAIGCRVHLLPVIGTGRTLVSKGFLKAAQSQARKVIEAIEQIDPQGKMAVVGVEPSEILTLREEYLGLLPGSDAARRLALRAFMVDEFLVRPAAPGGVLRISIFLRHQVNSRNGEAKAVNLLDTPIVHLHGHCHQKAQAPLPDGLPTGVEATRAMLELAGYPVKLIDAGCCGMAGAFGYEAEHYQVSMQIGELSLLPAVRQAEPGAIIAASGVSCLDQIESGAGRKALHPVALVERRIGYSQGNSSIPSR